MRSQASLLAYDILDRMRANPDRAIATGGFSYNIGLAEAPTEESCVDVSDPAALECTVAQLANADLTEWKDALDQLLPDGQGEIIVSEQPAGSGVFVAQVTVRWTDPAAAEGYTEIQMRSEL
jgi:type IV pilus assembly protein PilV